MSKKYSEILNESIKASRQKFKFCEAIDAYSKYTISHLRQMDLFANASTTTSDQDIRVIELFAGVGGFRIGIGTRITSKNFWWLGLAAFFVVMFQLIWYMLVISF